MTIINYVNINNIEKNIETIKSSYEVTAPVDMSSLNKVNIQNFLTPSYSIQVMTYTFSEEFRNTLIINSNNYQLGEITEDISFTIELYNNSEDNLTIENINIVNLYGIDLNLTSQNISGYNSNLITVNISASGESINEGYLEITINGISYFIIISYSREAIFSYMPDRGEDLTITYSFNTEIKKAISGKEYREGRFINPRFTVDYIYIEDGKNKRNFENTIISDNHSVLYLPIWPEKFYATKVDNRIYGDFKHTSIVAGSSIYAWEVDKSQILQVISVNADYIEVEKINNSFSKFFVYPLIKTRLSENVSTNQITKNMARFMISFIAEEADIENTLNNRYNFTYDNLNGLPFYDFLRCNSGRTQKTFIKSVTTLDNDISKRSKFVKYHIAETVQSFNMLFFGKEEITKIKDIFNKSAGALNSFYYIKDDADIELLENLSQSSTILTIRDNNSLTLFNNGVFNYLYILYNNKDPMILKVNEVRKGSNNTEIILVDPIPNSINLNKIHYISYICKGRFDTDDLSLSYSTDEIASATISIKNINGKE